MLIPPEALCQHRMMHVGELWFLGAEAEDMISDFSLYAPRSSSSCTLRVDRSERESLRSSLHDQKCTARQS